MMPRNESKLDEPRRCLQILSILIPVTTKCRTDQGRRIGHERDSSNDRSRRILIGFLRQPNQTKAQIQQQDLVALKSFPSYSRLSNKGEKSVLVTRIYKYFQKQQQYQQHEQQQDESENYHEENGDRVQKQVEQPPKGDESNLESTTRSATASLASNN